MTFEEMCLDTRIMRAIAEMGFEQPSPIQAQSIPIAVEGKDKRVPERVRRLRLEYRCCSELIRKTKICRQSSCAQRENLQFSPPMKFAN